MTLMMSVSGVRGIVGQTMTPLLAAEIGAAFGAGLGGGEVVVGRDSRISGEMLRNAVVAGLLAAGCDVVDLGVCATPTAGVMVLERRAVGGLMITASHNPIMWNGLKFITAAGHAPDSDTIFRVFKRWRYKEFSFVDVDHVGHALHDASANERHLARVLATVDVDAVRRRRFKVVLDSVNGGGCAAGRMLLERLGCQVVHVNGEPTGRFAHVPEPIAENLGDLCRLTRAHAADVGFAQDPDADRLAIVDNLGTFIGEEYTLALAAKHVFARRPGPAATNLSTSRMIDDLAASVARPPSAVAANDVARPPSAVIVAKQCVVHRTAVGEANVVAAMRRHGCVIGGEGNGGVIDPRVVPIRDSLAAMALTLDLLAVEGRPLDRVVAEMPRYVMVKKKLDLDRPRIDEWLKRVRGAVGDGRIDESDGIRIDWPQGWVHVRPSNTEPIARVIAEAHDQATAEALAAMVMQLV